MNMWFIINCLELNLHLYDLVSFVKTERQYVLDSSINNSLHV